eukprot:m.84985 g.84985  ORF g.84985 m.84985 type:complete len:74 (-) comp14412_c0_seq1:1550-1771(-)
MYAKAGDVIRREVLWLQLSFLLRYKADETDYHAALLAVQSQKQTKSSNARNMTKFTYPQGYIYPFGYGRIVIH